MEDYPTKTPITVKEEDVLAIYESSFSDNRERLVMALDKLAEYKDTTEFFDRHSYIHKYIFFMYLSIYERRCINIKL